MQPTVYGGRFVDAEPHVGHYYPRPGHKPGYGRLEIEPPANRILPKPAESYHQSWSAESAPPRAQPEVPMYPPPVIMAPQNGGDRHAAARQLQPQRPAAFRSSKVRIKDPETTTTKQETINRRE